jgi:hypothetical protein
MKYAAEAYTATLADAGGGRGVSSAMSWMYFLIVIAIVSLVALIFSSYVFYQRRD